MISRKKLDALTKRAYNYSNILAISRIEVIKLFPNLLDQKDYHHLTDEDMGRIIGVNQIVYHQKMQSGKFGPKECQAYCQYFHKSFEYLFATEPEEEKQPHT